MENKNKIEWHLIENNDYPTEEKEYLVTVAYKKMDGEDRYLDLAQFDHNLGRLLEYRNDEEYVNKKGFFRYSYSCDGYIELDNVVAWSDIQPYR